jgi:hypothetical protein
VPSTRVRLGMGRGRGRWGGGVEGEVEVEVARSLRVLRDCHYPTKLPLSIGGRVRRIP